MKVCLLNKILLLLVLKSAFAVSSPAQVTASITGPVMSLESQESLKEFLSTLERKFNVYFTFESILVRDKKVPPNALVSGSLDETLRRVLPQLELTYKKVSDQYYVIFRKQDNAPGEDQAPDEGKNEETANPPAETIKASVRSAALQVSGRITDENGEGMPAVNVVEKGTTNGVVADTDGRFAIQVNGPESVLVISFVGYKTVEETVGSRTEINVQLQPDVSTLSEIVVVGYGTQDKKALTAAVNTIDPKEITNRPVANMYQAMQGLAPNLTIQQNNAEPGSVPVLNIRGVGSFTDNSPLIIVDGIVVGPLGLNYLNPNDVENISVLKDAASAAIYGSQAANGVIYVTTKRGKRDEKTSVQYSGLFGLQSPTTSPKPVEAWEFMTLKNEARNNSGIAPSFTPEQIQQQRARGSYPWAYDKMVNNTVPMLNQNISITGGSKNTSYLLSAGYLNQQSMFNGDYIPDDQRFYYKRYNFRTNVSTTINKYIEAGVNLSYTNGTNRMHAFSTGLLIRDAMRTPRIYPIRDENNNWVVPELTSNSVFAQLVNGGWKLTQSNNLLGGVNVTITPLEHLKIKVNTSANYSFYNEELQRRKFDYAPEYSASAPPKFNEQSKASWNDLNTTFFATAEYDKTMGKHFAKVLAGYRSDFVRLYSHVSAYRGYGTIIDEDYMIGGDYVRDELTGEPGNITKYTGITNPELKTINSVFGRVNYSYDDKYLAEFTWRYDGATVLAPQNRWFFFPAFSLGWRLTDEAFMESVRDFADIKLRYSWGQVGNSNIGGFNYLARVRPVIGQYSFNNTGVQGVDFTTVNPELEWERSTMNDVGIDIALFQGKLSGSFDYFDKMTKGIYFVTSVPGTLGQGASIENFATVRNVGWEVSVNYHATSGPVSHTVGFNVADNTNKVLKVGEEQILGNDFNYIIKEGYPISAYYLYKSDGLYQNLDDIERAPKVPFADGQMVHPGDIRFVDKDNNGTLDDNDKFILGTPFPRYTFGINYSATYKNFDFQMFWQGVGKRSQYLRGDIVEAFHNNEEHLFVQHKDRWLPTNPDATYPRLTATSTSNRNNTQYSDYWLFDTKYIRLKNVQLGYTLPQSLTSKAGIQTFRIYFSAQNLLTFAPKRFAQLGMDPEFTQFDNKLNFANYDPIAGRNYPNAKVLAIGADIKF